MISRKMIAKIKENKGFSLTSILVAVVIIGILAFPMAKWFMSTAGNIGTNEAKAAAQTEKMEMQSVIQQYWQSMIDMSYDDFQAEIASKGTKRTEALGKYDLTIEFSGDSKYANALCNVGTAAGTNDRHCRRATITLVSKQNPTMVESFYATRVQPASLEAKLLKLTKDLQDEDDKFKDYDTKTEADNKYACPWDYKMNAANSACVACDAPSNWKQYRSGNCTLGTCPTGQQAKADRSGCENISCSGRTALDGDICKSCPLTGKEYYTSSSGCAKSTCPTGKKVNAAGTGCEAIVCTGRTSLSGDNCVACPLTGKEYYTSSSGCAKSTCATGKKVNAAGTGCEAITCASGKHLEGDSCVADTPEISNVLNTTPGKGNAPIAVVMMNLDGPLVFNGGITTGVNVNPAGSIFGTTDGRFSAVTYYAQNMMTGGIWQSVSLIIPEYVGTFSVTGSELYPTSRVYYINNKIPIRMGDTIIPANSKTRISNMPSGRPSSQAQLMANIFYWDPK